MKRMYWRPAQISRIELILVALLAAGAYMASELLLTQVRQPHYAEKRQAAVLAQRGLDAIKAERLRRGEIFDAVADPLQTGLIGRPMSPITTHSGSLVAKRTSVNPNFAAIMVQWLRDAGVHPGDTVAVGMSGSFPAFNVATLAAMQVMQLRPLVMVSATASQWGANDPNFLWLDMYRLLWEQGIVASRPIAASRGGIGDRAERLSPAGADMLDAAIARSGVAALPAPTYAASLQDHMQRFNDASAGRPIKAYINVGAGATSVGPGIGKHLFRPGLNTQVEEDRLIVDSVMQRFADAGVPLIHVIQAKILAAEAGLPVDPQVPPQPGEGGIFSRPAYSKKVAAIGFGLIALTMFAFMRMDINIRLRHLPTQSRP